MAVVWLAYLLGEVAVNALKINMGGIYL